MTILPNGDLELTGTPIPHDGDSVCPNCGRVLDPVQTLWSQVGLCVDCDRAMAARVVENRMVTPWQ